MQKQVVGIIMGSDSDLPIMQEAAKTLEEFGVPYDLSIVSAHRTPDWMREYAKNAAENGLKIIIAGAGGSAHLPGMTASQTSIPVIGVPIKTKNLDGLDSLLSIVQMPKGIPVATVAINGAENAALLAVSILSISDEKLKQKILIYKNKQQTEVLTKNRTLKQKGWRRYLDI